MAALSAISCIDAQLRDVDIHTLHGCPVFAPTSALAAASAVESCGGEVQDGQPATTASIGGSELSQKACFKPFKFLPYPAQSVPCQHE
jgi:hypothetical protein